MFDFDKFKRLDETNENLIRSEIKAVAKHYAHVNARERLHLVMDACCRHAVAHQDCSLLTYLWDTLTNNANHKGMGVWLQEYTTFKRLKNKKGIEMFLGRDDDGNKCYQYNLAGATMPFYDMPKVKKDKEDTWTLLGGLDSLISKAIKRNKEGKLPDSDKRLLEFLGKSWADFKAAEREAANKNEAPVDNVIEMHEAA